METKKIGFIMGEKAYYNNMTRNHNNDETFMKHLKFEIKNGTMESTVVSEWNEGWDSAWREDHETPKFKVKKKGGSE